MDRWALFVHSVTIFYAFSLLLGSLSSRACTGVPPCLQHTGGGGGEGEGGSLLLEPSSRWASLVVSLGSNRAELLGDHGRLEDGGQCGCQNTGGTQRCRNGRCCRSSSEARAWRKRGNERNDCARGQSGRPDACRTVGARHLCEHDRDCRCGECTTPGGSCAGRRAATAGAAYAGQNGVGAASRDKPQTACTGATA